MSKAKLRSVNTHFWTDSYIIDLDSVEKLLFLYLLTNPLANIAGCYEISVRQIVFDTGIPQVRVAEILAKFERSRKMVYRDGWILIVNFLKNQNLNENMRKGADALLSVAPEWVKKPFESLSKPFEPFQSLRKEEREVEVEREGEKEHKSACVNPSVAAREVEYIDFVMAGLRERFGLLQLRDEPLWADEIAHAFTNHIPPEQFLETFDLLRLQKWRKGRVTAKIVGDNIHNIVKLRTEIEEQDATPITNHREARERQAIEERNFLDAVRREVAERDGQLPQTNVVGSSRQLRAFSPEPDDGREGLPC